MLLKSAFQFIYFINFRSIILDLTSELRYMLIEISFTLKKPACKQKQTSN